MKIISGGQTGVDRAALDAALLLGIPCGGWCPKGRRAEDGIIDPKYPLKETPTAEYGVRTEWNVRDSDATLIFTKGKPTKGTAFTIFICKKLKKPHLIVDVNNEVVEQICTWLSQNNFQTLNIAGPRESNFPGIYDSVKAIVESVFRAT